jgi:F0F1-type ATP synthase assembly protein I
MTVTISAAFLLGVIVYLLCKYAGQKPWQAAVSILFGFFLASTGIAPYINQFTETLIRLL